MRARSRNYVSLKHAADALRISEATLTDLQSQGRIAAFRDPSGALRFSGPAVKAFEARYIRPSAHQQDLDLKAGLIGQSLRRWRQDGDVGHIARIAEDAAWICSKILGSENTTPLLIAAVKRAHEAEQ